VPSQNPILSILTMKIEHEIGKFLFISLLEINWQAWTRLPSFTGLEHSNLQANNEVAIKENDYLSSITCNSRNNDTKIIWLSQVDN
jgi:hypothetical protein